MSSVSPQTQNSLVEVQPSASVAMDSALVAVTKEGACDQDDDLTLASTKQCPIAWYRTPVPPKVLKSLHERSDAKGWFEVLSHLGLLGLTGSAAFYAAGRFPVWVVLLLVFAHGTVSSFINGVHELGHGTVFKTKSLNAFFVRIFAFLTWFNFEIFQVSHARHHRYTLHAPDDLEVVLPMKFMVRQFFLEGFVDPLKAFRMIKNTVRVASGRLTEEWERKLYPEPSPERSAAINWARTLLVGHGLIAAVALYFHLWMLLVLITLAPFYGGWLFFLCNNTQHIGLQDDIPDFRLCARSFLLNPFVEWLYWHMNYHIEHHMYAAVPCYNLARLRRTIEHDLPPAPKGLIATWREIAAIQKIQDENPGYQYVAPVTQEIGKSISRKKPDDRAYTGF